MASFPSRALDSRPLLWALLAVPAAHLLYLHYAREVWPDELIPPSGAWAARFIILALMLTPLSLLLPGRGWVAWLIRRRRAFGVAAFFYSLLHLAFYLTDMGALQAVLDELRLTGIWTGWAALALMLPLALTSNDAAMRALKSGWKKLQRLAYPAALLTLIHWIVVHNSLYEALAWFTPLGLLQLARFFHRFRRRAPVRSTA